MALLITCLATFFVAFSIFACGYFYFLLLARLFGKKNKLFFTSEHDILHRMAVVIPAHNEAQCISHTLQSCLALDYPIDRFQVVVIADNCQDETANIARSEGVRVIERFDINQKGKGYALAYAFSILLQEAFDAFLVVDADCTIDPQALTVLAPFLAHGFKTVQLNNGVANPDASPMTYALAVGNHMENAFFYSPKSRLGWAVLLRGTGMVLTKDALSAVPWAAFSVTEDIEYGVNLLAKGFKIAFVEEARVASPFPVDQQQLEVQRKRWASGNLSFGRKEAFKLIMKGVARRHWLLVDSGVTFLLLSKPLILLTVGIAFLLSFLSVLFRPTLASFGLLVTSSICAILLCVYFFAGIFSFGLNAKRFNLLLRVPGTVFRLVRIAVQGLVGGTDKVWKKTPR